MVELLDKKTTVFVKTILNHWENCRREFPWRKTKNPYYILVTEILLRKTTASQVDKIYAQFFDKYPNPDFLANADHDEIKKLLKPLGFVNKRSEGLIKLSKQIKENYDGIIPNDSSKLMKLYGVGKYTSGGVMCLAYNIDSAMVDTNVIRVIERYFNFKSSKKRPRDDEKLWYFVKNMIPKGKCKEFNLGLIDFASSLCTSKNPKCIRCELKNSCDFYSVQF